MSNRKFRTNRSDFLFMLARKKVSDRYDLNNPMHQRLLKGGLVKLVRSKFRARRYDNGPDPRLTSMMITVKGWISLLRRSRGHDNNVRVHQSLEHLVNRHGRFWNKGEVRDEIIARLNCEDPNDLSIFARKI